MLGAAAGMLMAPQLSRGTRKKMKKRTRNMMDTAENAYDIVMNMIR
nr:YtxH domain-containing protein [Clostridium aestuarii]